MFQGIGNAGAELANEVLGEMLSSQHLGILGSGGAIGIMQGLCRGYINSTAT